MARLLRRIWADRRGLSAVEFALVLPILVMLAVGVMEFGRLILVTQKLQNGAFILADLAARDETLSEGQVEDIFEAFGPVIQPFDFPARGAAFLAAVRRPPTGAAQVAWLRTGGGALAATSTIGAEGADAVLPGRFTLAVGETVIVAEVVFAYEPMFGTTVLARTIRKQAFVRPRIGALETLDP